MKNTRTKIFWCWILISGSLGFSVAVNAVDTKIRYEKIGEREKIIPPGSFDTRDNFFTDILYGTPWSTEEDLRDALEKNNQEIPSHYVVCDEHGNTIWNNKFNCGKFEQVSINELTNEIDSTKKEFPNGGSLNVIDGYETRGYSWFSPYVDVAYLQSLSENNGAVFQVASNFGGLETTSADEKISETLAVDLCSDHTQGPAAVIGTPAGLLLRRYLLNHSTFTNSSLWGQNEARPVNFLGDVAEKVTVSPAGYVVFDNQIFENAPTDGDYKKMKVGFHRNVQVTNSCRAADSYTYHYSLLKEDRTQIIHQAFTAAVDFAETNKPYKPYLNPGEWGQYILNLAYEAPLKKAFLIGAQKVFLTMVGGGVFGNKLDDIFDAIKRMEEFIKQSGMKVYLVLRTSDNKKDEELREKLLQMVTNTNGTYLQYRSEGVFKATLHQ